MNTTNTLEPGDIDKNGNVDIEYLKHEVRKYFGASLAKYPELESVSLVALMEVYREGFKQGGKVALDALKNEVPF